MVKVAIQIRAHHLKVRFIKREVPFLTIPYKGMLRTSLDTVHRRDLLFNSASISTIANSVAVAIKVEYLCST
jgi:hypothetical protein